MTGLLRIVQKDVPNWRLASADCVSRPSLRFVVQSPLRPYSESPCGRLLMSVRNNQRGVFVKPKYAFFGGRIVPYSEAKVGILTHALNYGTAVFGGLRGYWNEDEKQLFVFRPLDHFRRFLQSAKLLCMENSSASE